MGFAGLAVFTEVINKAGEILVFDRIEAGRQCGREADIITDGAPHSTTYFEFTLEGASLDNVLRDLTKVDGVVGAVETRDRLLRPLGSTADRVVRQATCPVLVIRPGSAFPPARLLAPVDLSDIEWNAAITYTAAVLREIADRRSDVYLGHIGGDDFVLITDASEAEPVCEVIVKSFDHDVRTLYEPEVSSALEGITRDAVIRIAQDSGMPVVAKRITRDEVYIADRTRGLLPGSPRWAQVGASHSF